MLYTAVLLALAAASADVDVTEATTKLQELHKTKKDLFEGLETTLHRATGELADSDAAAEHKKKHKTRPPTPASKKEALEAAAETEGVAETAETEAVAKTPRPTKRPSASNAAKTR